MTYAPRSVVFVLAFALSGIAAAQTTEGTPQSRPQSSKGTPASNPSTTMAPVAAGSTEMRKVPTPTEPPRTTATGGNTNGGGN